MGRTTLSYPSPGIATTADNAVGCVVDDSRRVKPATGIPSIERHWLSVLHRARLNLAGDPSDADESVQRWIHGATLYAGEHEHLVAGKRFGVQAQHGLDDLNCRWARLSHLWIVAATLGGSPGVSAP
jgi:hypothetical protein